MKTKENTIYNEHTENMDWLSRLFFYKDEIAIMQRRLEEIVQANNSKEVLAQVEHFQNQLIIQKNNIDMIKHDVKQNESSLVKNITNNPVAVDHRKVVSHEKEKEEIETFEKHFNELRKELQEFLSKWL